MKTIDPNQPNDRRGRELSDGDTIRFRCHAALNCFNQCCRNLNLYLYPYDIVRLKKALSIRSDDFIDRHVDVVLRKGHFFPDVLLRMADDEEKTCPFLTDDGCTIYPDRPDTCRSFPVEHGLRYRENGPPVPVYFYRPPDFCLGKHEDTRISLAEWGKSQEATRYRDMTRQWAEVRRLFHQDPWRGEGPSGSMGKMAFMAAYNVDGFRDFVFGSSFLKRFRVQKKILDKARRGDRALMLLGFEWIKLFVFRIASDQINPR